MKRRAFNLCLLLIIVLISGSSTFATSPILENTKAKAKEEFTKQINKDFPITADGTINLTNKYGDIKLKTWNQNKVSIKITIKVQAKNESTAKEVFDRIDFKFDNGSDYVKAETIIENKNKNSWWGWTNNNKTEFKINYEVNMPKGGALDVYNKYGDVFAAEIDGRAKVAVDYGNLRMDGVNNSVDVKLGYSNGTIYKCKDADAYVKYGKLKFIAADDMRIESKYSKVFIDAAKKVKSNSKYDTYEVGNIETLRSEGKYDNYQVESARAVDFSARYSDLRMRKLSDRANVSMEYGSFDVGDMGKDFSEINLEGKYADFKIDLHESSQFQMELSGTYADISYPSGMEINYEKEKSNEHEVRGYKGSKTGGGKIHAEVRYGGVKLR